ncbi:hypothetical protein [Devosia sp.]|jgi:hypothetical protein|uniref:hypothetical protein n=1 Tax=Devosia sp. TaxID=1871048 RepID=UPI0037C14629
MPDRIQDNTPPEGTPVQLTAEQMERNEREARAEIGRRARALARRCIETNEEIRPEELAQFGLAGQAYFMSVLRDGLQARLQQSEARRPAASASTRPPGAPLLRTTRNWSAQRRERPSYVRRSMRAGFWLAFCLIVPSVAALHVWPDGEILPRLVMFLRSFN